jgi:hypothetical protein
MHDYHRLLVWEKSHAVSVAVHRLTERIPRRYNADLIGIALASASELEYHLEFAADAELIDRSLSAARRAGVVEIRKMLVGLIRRMQGEGSARNEV